MPTEFKEATAKACRFGGGEMKFAEGEATAPENKPIRMLARTAGPINHWYWGRCVHDMTGMKLHKEVLPCDYEHWDPIGFLNKFDAGNEGLFVEGELVPTDEPNDQARKIIKLAAGGVPWEASIDFSGDGIKYEYVAEGQVALVNGYSFDGPGVIFREWPLRGVAVCPYGADMNTNSAFARAGDETFSVTQLSEDPMKTGTKPATKLSDNPPADPPATPVDENQPTTPAGAPATPETPAGSEGGDPPADEPPSELSAGRKEAARFKKLFGDQGAVWFAEGLSFEEAQQKANASLSDRLAAVEAQLKAGANVTGEGAAAGFSAADDPKAKRKGFASRFNLPGESAAT